MARANPILPIGPLVKPKRNKYGVSPPEQRTFDGKVYASKAEMIRAQEWAISLRNFPDIAVFEQVRVSLGCRENIFVVDFLTWGKRAGLIAEEVKGMRTAKFERDVKLWKRYGPCPLHILTRDGSSWKTEIITPILPEPPHA